MLFRVYGDEFENAILSDDAYDRLPTRLVVDIDQGDSAGSAFQHAAAGFVQRPRGVDGYGLERENADSFLDICG